METIDIASSPVNFWYDLIIGTTDFHCGLTAIKQLGDTWREPPLTIDSFFCFFYTIQNMGRYQVVWGKMMVFHHGKLQGGAP